MEEDLKGPNLTRNLGGLGWRGGEVDELVDDQVLGERFTRASDSSAELYYLFVSIIKTRGHREGEGESTVTPEGGCGYGYGYARWNRY